jgi:broad specificity phosphatase PhoE
LLNSILLAVKNGYGNLIYNYMNIIDSESKSQYKKLVICLRHGERSDYAGQVSCLHKFDPELTDNGKLQAYMAGKNILGGVKSIMGSNINGRIMILSSPFARTLQTARQVYNALNEEINKNQSTLQLDNQIHVDHLLCEFIEESFNNELPIDFLSIYNNSKFLDKELKEIELKFINEKKLLPGKKENSEECFDRLKTCAKNVIENMFNTDTDIVILVSHGTPIDNLNKAMGYPGPHGPSYIEYCSHYFYGVDLEREGGINLNVNFIKKDKPKL